MGGFEAAGEPVAGDCGLAPWCFSYPFVLTTNATFEADLVWFPPGNDFDLVVHQDGTEVARAASRGVETSEVLDLQLHPGEYAVTVVPYAVPQADATLDVRFGPSTAGT